jgi:hypothetical protein
LIRLFISLVTDKAVANSLFLLVLAIPVPTIRFHDRGRPIRKHSIDESVAGVEKYNHPDQQVRYGSLISGLSCRKQALQMLKDPIMNNSSAVYGSGPA